MQLQMTIKMMTVDGSSNISEIGYEPKTKAMRVRFSNGGLYSHLWVPKALWDQFKNAESKGSFYSTNFRGKFDCLKVREDV